MKIALLGSVSEKLPPDGQAAIERLAYQQALGLADRGNKILLFALKGSKISHKNIEVIEVGESSTLSGTGKEGIEENLEKVYGISYKLRLEIVHLAQVIKLLIQRQSDYECILNNLRGEAILIPVAQDINKPLYHVMHLPIFPQLAEFITQNPIKLISISNAQRHSFPNLPYVGTVYNGVDIKEFSFSAKPQNYVLYLGSIGRNKNPKDALLAAREVGVKILIGGRIKDQKYYESEIKPFIDGKQVKWIGEKDSKEIVTLYQGAKAFLFPTLWDEPFGLVAIEALSCGTPVIAYPNGALPEIIEEGTNGYLVNNVSEMAIKIKEVEKISRTECRKTVEEKFTLEKMVKGYEKILQQ